MKRCPECGFRANDTVCPLCGVKMRGNAEPIRTHTHSQIGEKCVLPGSRSGGEAYQPQQNSTRRQRRERPNFGVLVFIIIMFILLRSCAWL